MGSTWQQIVPVCRNCGSDIVIDGRYLSVCDRAGHSAAAGFATVFLDMTLRGYSAILASNNDDPKRFDFENSTFDGGPGSSADIAFGPSNPDRRSVSSRRAGRQFR